MATAPMGDAVVDDDLDRGRGRGRGHSGRARSHLDMRYVLWVIHSSLDRWRRICFNISG